MQRTCAVMLCECCQRRRLIVIECLCRGSAHFVGAVSSAREVRTQALEDRAGLLDEVIGRWIGWPWRRRRGIRFGGVVLAISTLLSTMKRSISMSAPPLALYRAVHLRCATATCA